MFLVGAFVWEFFDELIEGLKKFWPVALLVSVVVNYFNIDIGNYPLLKSVSLLCFSIGFGYAFPKLMLKHDLSYGLYLYHMVAINVMVFYGMSGTVLNIVIAFTASMMLSVISFFATRSLFLGKNAPGMVKNDKFKRT